MSVIIKYSAVMIFITLFSFGKIFAQEFETKSIHQIMKIENQNSSYQNQKSNAALSPDSSSEKRISKKVFGYFPSWSDLSSFSKYDFSVITHIGFFDYGVDTASGKLYTGNSSKFINLIDLAKANGCKTALTVTNFGISKNTALLSSPIKRNKLISDILNEILLSKFDGVNIDFESVSGTQKDNMTAFFKELDSTLNAANPKLEISIAAPAVDWNKSFNLPVLSEYIDMFVIMGYDYYWSTSETAGPVAPLEGENYNVTRSVNYYCDSLPDYSKILLGVPWYGYEWKTENSDRKSKAVSSAAAMTYPKAETYANQNGKIFDTKTKTVYYSRYDAEAASNKQCWYDDSLSLAYKYALVNEKQLGGIGIWAVSYTGTERKELWNGIAEAFPIQSGIAEDCQSNNIEIKIIANSVIIKNSDQILIKNIKIYDILGRVLSNNIGAFSDSYKQIQINNNFEKIIFIEIETETRNLHKHLIVD